VVLSSNMCANTNNKEANKGQRQTHRHNRVQGARQTDRHEHKREKKTSLTVCSAAAISSAVQPQKLVRVTGSDVIDCTGTERSGYRHGRLYRRVLHYPYSTPTLLYPIWSLSFFHYKSSIFLIYHPNISSIHSLR